MNIPTALRADHHPDRLIAGSAELVTNHRTLTGGTRYARGTVMGVVAASGAMTICTTSASDGSETPVAILAADSDCAGGDLPSCAAFEKGEFNANAILLGDGWTTDSIYEPLRRAGINLVRLVSVSGVVL